MALYPAVLVVDDDAGQRASLIALLEGYRVVAAGSLAEARHALGTRLFDVAIVDLHLPDGRGSELLPLLGGAVAIFVSGEAQARELKPGAAFRVLTKPYDPAILLSNVATAAGVAMVRRSTPPRGTPKQ